MIIHLFNIFQFKISVALLRNMDLQGFGGLFFLDVRVCHCFFWKITFLIPLETSSAHFQEEAAGSLTRHLCLGHCYMGDVSPTPCLMTAEADGSHSQASWNGCPRFFWHLLSASLCHSVSIKNGQKWNIWGFSKHVSHPFFRSSHHSQGLLRI